MTTQRDFLFTTWEGGGNIAPVMTLVRRLRARGHRVRILGDACTGSEALRAGAEFVSWQKAPSRQDNTRATDPMRDWEAADPMDVIRRIIDRLMCGTALLYAEDVLAEMSRRSADAIITSEMLLGPMIAGEAAGVPVAALSCNIPIIPLPGVPPFGPGFAPARTDAEHQMHAAVTGGLEALLQEGLPALNAARQALGLAPLVSVWEQFGRLTQFLSATAQAFDFPAERLPSNLRYIGPLLDEPGWVGTWAHSFADKDRPLIVVAFSTTFQDQTEPLQRVIDAIGELPANAVVTTGPSLDPSELNAPENVSVIVHAPHDLLMTHASVVVTHGGHGTVMRALRAGLPLLCMPMGRDQADNAARVTERGAGLRLETSASAADIRGALTRLLWEPSFRSAATRLSRAISAETSPERAADIVETLFCLRSRAAA